MNFLIEGERDRANKLVSSNSSSYVHRANRGTRSQLTEARAMNRVAAALEIVLSIIGSTSRGARGKSLLS